MENNYNKDQITEIHNELIEQTKKELELSNVLYLIVRYCLTPQGKELILNSEFLPINTLNKELEQVQELFELNTTDENFPLERIEDIRDYIKRSKIDGAILEIQEMQQIVALVRLAKTLRRFISPRKNKYTLLFEEISLMYEDKTLEKKLNATIDENGNIRDNATPELSKIRTNLRNSNSQLHSRMTKLVREYSEADFVNDDFYTIKDGRFVLSIKASYKRRLQGIVHSASQTGTTVYFEPNAVIDLNNELALLHSAELREINKILKQLTKLISTISDDLLNTYSILSHIDSVNAKAQYAINNSGIKPIITNENILELKKVYHPLLVNKVGRKNVVPLTISFSANNKGHLISGPNAGGKTIAMKTTGLAVMMTKLGIFPLGEVRVRPIDVYSSIGDGQSLEQNLSTFSFQLTRLKDILDVATNDCLLLIDEICSGTDPREGSALASGILDTFIELGLFFIVTTHQSSLKVYALNHTKNKVIQNDSFEFDADELRPTFIFKEGLPGNSFAFFLAKNVGLSSLVIKRAKKYLGNRHKQLERSISTLQAHKKEYESLVLESRRQLLETEKIKENYRQQQNKITESKNKIINNAKIEAEKILKNATEFVENTIKELKTAKKNELEIIRQFKNKKQEIANETAEIKRLEATIKDDLQLAIHLEVNDIVGMVGNNSAGMVLEADNKEKIALVSFNGLKFRLPFDQLYLTTKKNLPVERKVVPLKLDVQTKLDLRGYRVEEALKEVDKFISEAIHGNVDFVSIIHGKGTGVLREVIHNYLKTFSVIKSFRLGEIYEGGSGATFVYFR